MEQTQIQPIEPKFRLNIKQSAKGERYWDITCRGSDLEQLTLDIESLKRLAMIQCNQLIKDEESEIP